MTPSQKTSTPSSLPFMGPETRPFWVFLPFLIIVLGITSAYLKSPINLIVGVLLLISGVVVFSATRRSASLKSLSTSKQDQITRIVEIIDDALIAYNEKFTVTLFNSTAERLFMIKAADIVGTVIKPQDADSQGKRLLVQTMFPTLAPRMVSKSAVGVYPQVTDISLDSPALELRVVTSKIEIDGTTTGFLKVIKNRTREVVMLRTKNEFVTVASHQLRTPVNELAWALQALVANETLPADVHTMIAQAQLSAIKLQTLVDDLLNVSRLEEGRFGYQFVAQDMVSFLGTIATEMMPRAERNGLAIYFDRPKEALPQVTIDAEKLSLAITNLLDNALRYNVEHGQVTLGVKQSDKGSYLEVSIKDSGIGIPPEQVGKLFGKFFRADNAVKSATEGSGLGLYICKNIIEAHGGQIWAESELNRGTTFYFTIPTDPNLVPASEQTIE